MNNIQICVQALVKLGTSKGACQKMLVDPQAVDYYMNWTQMADEIRSLGGTTQREDIRQLCHRGIKEPYYTTESRDFATAIKIVAGEFKLEPLNLERFM